ncbi:MAK10-like protein [Tanacetum coccineum]
MAVHAKRMERLENAIFKQPEVINDRMTYMFGLLKELSASRTPKKSTVEPSKSEEEESPKKAFVTNKFERRADDKPTKSEREKVTKNKAEEAAGASSSHTFNDSPLGVRVGKIKGKTYNLSPRWPVYEVILKKKITKKKDIGENFEIPCNIGGLTHINSLVDQGSDVNVMPFSTYSKLTNERPTETDIRLSLASHSYIYPLGIAKDVVVDVAGYVYPMDFVILDIKEDEKRPFILGTPFLTTAKAVIKFDKGTITLRSGKSKISFYSILESLCKVEKGIKNDIEPIAPTMTINRLVLEWKEKIKLHQEKETKKFLIKNEDEIFTVRGDGVEIKPEASRLQQCEDSKIFKLYLTKRSLEVLRKFHSTTLGGRFNQLSHVSSPLLSKPGEY